MIRSNLLARRIAAAAAAPGRAPAASLPSSSSAVEFLSNRGAPSAPAANVPAAAPFPTPEIATRRPFSADAATELGSILQREIEEEDEKADGNGGGLPGDLSELDAEVRAKWTVVGGISGLGGAGGETGSGASVRMFRKEVGSKGAKIGVVFHCQDTEDDVKYDEDEFISDFEKQHSGEPGQQEEEEQEPVQAVRFGVTVSKGGKTVVVQCRVGSTGDLDVESVVVRDGDTESVLAMIAAGEGAHASLYQGPEFSELAEDLQESFQRYVVEECGVDENLTAYISMYSDYREQAEYVAWMKTAIDILD